MPNDIKTRSGTEKIGEGWLIMLVFKFLCFLAKRQAVHK
jgi:hypothetical protein